MNESAPDDLFSTDAEPSAAAGKTSAAKPKTRRAPKANEPTSTASASQRGAELTDSETQKQSSLEENLRRLEEIVERIENSDIGLEDSITLYAEGTRLGNSCLQRLSNLEQRIHLIRQKSDGTLEQTPFQDDES
ncbi:MAG: exodeoxyribonuclease VII small subunit [Sumerlaeia bacterium]